MNFGLRAKLTGAIASFMMLLAVFIIIYFPWRQARFAESSLESRARDTASALAASLTADVSAEQKSRVHSVLEAFAESRGQTSDIHYIVVLRDGQEFDRWAAKKLPEGLIELRPMEDDEVVVWEAKEHLHIGIKLMTTSSGRVGTLYLGISQNPVDVAVWSSRVDGLVLGGVILLIGLIVAWLLGNSLTTPILEVARELEDVSSELAAAARDQEASSAEEAAAVAQTRRSMETLLDSAQKIADRSSEALGNAERSTNGSRQVASRIGGLNHLSERIAEILGSIMQVADKADLLALNASLEGTRAGEAGKGFALVGAEMRRLAENVIESVSGIHELMGEMRELSQAAVSASQEGTTSITATRHSAQEIAMLTQDQRKATEQVIASMDELGSILNLTLDGIQRTSASAGKLTTLASSLSNVVKRELEEANQRDEAIDFGEETLA